MPIKDYTVKSLKALIRESRKENLLTAPYSKLKKAELYERVMQLNLVKKNVAKTININMPSTLPSNDNIRDLSKLESILDKVKKLKNTDITKEEKLVRLINRSIKTVNKGEYTEDKFGEMLKKIEKRFNKLTK